MEEGVYKIGVIDTGLGISENNIPKLFKKFTKIKLKDQTCNS